jgi:hypothetical protein
VTPPRGPAIDVFFNFDHGCYPRYRQHPPRGAPSTSSSTLVVAAVRDTNSTPRGPGINAFFNFGGGYCWRYRQQPLGGPPSTSSSTSVVATVGDTSSQGTRHQHLLQLRWWVLPEIPTAPSRGAAIDVWLNLLPATTIFLVTPTRGPPR